MTPQSQAQLRADQIESFRRELIRLEQESVLELNSHQKEAISAYHQSVIGQLSEKYDVDVNVREKQLALGMRVASFLGALGFAASLFFLFYQFWGYFSPYFQAAILMLTPLIFVAGAALIAEKEKTGYFSKIVGMVSIAAFVLNLVMFGRIFNMAHSHTAFLVWAILAVLLAYACNARLLLAAGIIAFAGYLSAQVGTWGGCYWLHFGERPENFFPAGCVLIVLGFIQQKNNYLFGSIYRVFGLLAIFIPVLILANWGRISYLPLSYYTIEILYQVFAFILSAAFIWLGIRKQWPDMVNTSNSFFVLFLYTKFFDWWWDVMPKYMFFLVIGLFSLLFLFVFKRLRTQSAGGI